MNAVESSSNLLKYTQILINYLIIYAKSLMTLYSNTQNPIKSL